MLSDFITFAGAPEGPPEWMGFHGIPVVDEAEHAIGEVISRGEDPIPEHAPMEDPKPDLDLVDPRGMNRSMDEVEAASVPFVELFPPLTMVDVEVVPDNVDLPMGIAACDGVHERQQIVGGAPRYYLSDDSARRGLERGA